jgi:cytochrome P450 / NADPH-cytochrome P450 reductase
MLRLWLSVRKLSSFPAVRVLYGSQTGTSQSFAQQLASQLADGGRQAEALALDEFDRKSLADSSDKSLHLFLVSCFGVGVPTDNAADFCKWAAETSTPLTGRPYAVFGLGNSRQFPERYNVVGKRLDADLARLGGQRLLPFGAGDDAGCIEVDFDNWSKVLLDKIGPSLDAAPRDEGALVIAAAAPAVAPPPVAVDVSFHKKGPIKVKVTSTTCETPLSPKPIMSASFLLPPDAPPLFKSGDHIAVFPTNPPPLVDATLPHLLADPDEFVALSNPDRATVQFFTPSTPREILRRFVDLSGPPPPQLLRAFAAHASIRDAAALQRRAEPDVYVEYVRGAMRDTVDVLKEFPSVKIPLERLLTAAAPIRPRLYSVASSPKVRRAVAALTWRVHSFDTPRGLKKGLCSNFLADLSVGQEIVIGFRAADFHIADFNKPLLFIAGGAGVAPFLAFAEELKEEGGGPVSMIYGCKDEGDVVQKPMWDEMERQGRIKMRYAYFASPSHVNLVFVLTHTPACGECGGRDHGRGISRVGYMGFGRGRVHLRWSDWIRVGRTQRPENNFAQEKRARCRSSRHGVAENEGGWCIL